MTHKTERLRAAGAAIAIATALTLTGCFSNPFTELSDKVSEEVAKGGAEKLIEGVTGEDTNIQFGDLPDGFPEEVPLVSTNIIHGTTVETSGGKGMVVAVSDPRSLSELTEVVRADFAGWEEVSWTDMEQLVGGVFQKDSLSVTVGLIGGDGEDTNVSYTVNIKE